MKLSSRESTCLDLIRAAASQAVVIGHGMGFFGVFTFLHEPNFPWIQNIAVVIFFILSGFVITYSSLLKSSDGNYNFFDFFADRASRIFSAYIVALIFVLLIDSISIHIDNTAYSYHSAFNLKTLISNTLMLQDYPLDNFIGIDLLNVTSFGSARVFWTISIEWWIYMFFGVVFFTLFQKERITVIKSILFVISLQVVVWYLYESRGEHLSVYWLFGMLWMLAYQFYKSNVKGITPNIIILVCSFSACIAIQINMINAFNFYFAVFLSVVFISITNLSNYIKIEKLYFPINLIAGYSFTLYLIHYSVMDFIFRHVEITNKYVIFACAIIISNILAFIISRYSERIFRVILKRTIYKARHYVSDKETVKERN